MLDALANVFESKLLSVVTELRQENQRESERIDQLQSELQSASERIEALESYSRRDNLIISGLPVNIYAEATTTDAQNSSGSEGMQSVLRLFNQQLDVPVKSSDILIAHRMKKRDDSGPSNVFV